MRATLINHRYFPFRGGSEVYIQRLAEWFVSLGGHSRVVTTEAFDLEYFWDGGRRTVAAPRSEIVNGVEVQRLAVEHYPVSTLLFQGTRRMLGEMSRAVDIAAPYLMLSSQFPRIPGIPQALRERPRPDLFVGANLGLEGLPLAALNAAQELDVPFMFLPFAHVGRREDQAARRYVSMPHQRKLLRQSDLVITLTRLEADFVVEMGVDQRRIVVAGAGVDDDVFATGPCDRNATATNGELMILSAGAMAPDKGTIDLVHASRILAAEGLKHRLVLIGPELSVFSDWFSRSGAAECDWIERRGVVSDMEKDALFREADVFVLASRTESFGIVYLEAWAQCVPVIGADVGAVAEVITDGEDGLLVPFGEPRELASAIRTLAGDPRLRHSLGSRGREKVVSMFTWGRVLGRIGEGMERVLGLRVS